MMIFSASCHVSLVAIFSAVLAGTDGFLFTLHPPQPADIRTRCPPLSYQQGKVKLFRDKCYTFIMDREVYWADARDDCQNKGGIMVVIDDAATQQFIYSTLRLFNYGHHGIWIGLTDKGHELDWVWANGERLGHYANWGSGQGSGLLHQLYDCAYMRYSDDGDWHDAYCGTWPTKYSYICQFDAYPTRTTPTTTSIAPPTTTTTTSTLPVTTVTDGTSRTASTEPMTKTETVATTVSTESSTLESPHTDSTQITKEGKLTNPTAISMEITISTKPTVVMETTIPTTVVMETTIPTTTTKPATMRVTTVGHVCDHSPCNRDCGFYGFKVDGYGCQLCVCNV